MSLVKVALFGTVGGLSTIGFGTFLAKSGDPLGYLTRKAKSNIITKRLQKVMLAGIANMEKQMRSGRVADATKIQSSVLDALTGHSGTIGSTLLEDARNATGAKKWLMQGTPKYLPKQFQFSGVLNEAIDNEGRYRINNIENLLQKGNQFHSFMEKIKDLPIAKSSLVGGAAIGYAVGDKDHKLKSTIKGGLIGGSIGRSLRSGINTITNDQMYGMIPKVYQNYFADNYWRKQLEGANKGIYRKIGQGIGKAFTTTPGKRLARMQSHEALNTLKDTDITDLPGLWKNTKDFGKAFGRSFKKEQTLAPTVIPEQTYFSKLLQPIADKIQGL